MEKVKIARKDMSISKISEKILKISEDYEKAKKENKVISRRVCSKETMT